MSEPKIRSKQFIYRNSLKWLGEKRGLLSSVSKPDIQVCPPPEFKGEEVCWNAEELFVASINTCIMLTFLYYASRQNLGLLSYESDAEGLLEKVEDKFMFSRIIVKPKILVNSDSEIEKAKQLFEFSKKHCLISNSVKSEIILQLDIEVGNG